MPQVAVRTVGQASIAADRTGKHLSEVTVTHDGLSPAAFTKVAQKLRLQTNSTLERIEKPQRMATFKVRKGTNSAADQFERNLRLILSELDRRVIRPTTARPKGATRPAPTSRLPVATMLH